MFCVKCGAQLSEGALFCEKCGAQQLQQPQQPVYQQPVYQQPQQPVYQQPVYQQPVYQQPAYQQPVYQQPAYQQPAYQQPAYQQPAYQQPAYQPQQYAAPQSAPASSGVSTAVKTAAKGAAKGGASALKWILIAVAVVSVIAVVIFVFDPLNFLKSDEDLIRERIEAFEDAYNNGDWEGILDCMDAGTRSMLNLTMGFAEGLMGEAFGMDISVADVFALSGIMLEGEFCTIEILNIQIDGDYAEVTVVMTMDMYDYRDSEEFVLPLVKEGSDWYITGMDDLFGY